MPVIQTTPRWHVPGALATWLIPGLGHWMLGQRGRGLILLTCIGSLWLSGFFIGGINVFDRKGHPIWYIGQALIAPSILVDFAHRSMQGPLGLPARPDAASIPYTPSYGHIHEQGVLYTSLAGMLNLLAMMDVLYYDPNARRGRPREDEPAGDAPATDGGVA